MFRCLAKKKPRSPIDLVLDSLDERSVKALGVIALVLAGQLRLCRSCPNYKAELRSKFVRGYLFGFIDASLQRLDLPCSSEEEAILRIIAGHSFVFLDQKIDAIQYVKDSVDLQDDPTYKAAHQQGVEELYAYLEPDGKSNPIGLLSYFHPLDLSEDI